ncbi:BBC multi-domain protein [Pyrenophora tritici-repentis]|nr:BBC multi-domain protein [Pyrenophora tritici-repentis]
MSSQDTIEDPTLYQDMPPADNLDNSAKAAASNDSPHPIRPAFHSSKSAPGRREDSQSNERMGGQPRHTAEPSPYSKLERVRLLVDQLDSTFTKLKESMEEIVNSIEYFVKHVEELNDELRNEVGKMKDITQRCQQGRGILKRVRQESDDEYQPV